VHRLTFDGDGDAVQRAHGLAGARELVVEPLGARERLVREEVHEAVGGLVRDGRALEVRRGDLHGGELARGDVGRELRRVPRQQLDLVGGEDARGLGDVPHVLACRLGLEAPRLGDGREHLRLVGVGADLPVVGHCE
jgi:hypothetical protein